MSSSFPEYDKSTPQSKKERRKQLSFCEQLKLFLFYENPITFLLGHGLKIKFCKKREKTRDVKQNMKRLSDKFDLKKILSNMTRFEDSIRKLEKWAKPPDKGGPLMTRDRWKKGPDKPPTRP